jgi:hypothetical protein
MLNFLKSMAALRAAIPIQRQVFDHLERSTHTLLLYRGAASFGEVDALAGYLRLAQAARQCTQKGTDALTSSHASVSVPFPPPSSVSVYFKSSTIAGGLVVIILVLPKSFDGS